MRFWILLLSARSDILVQSSSGFAELLKALLVPCCDVEKCLGAGKGAWYTPWCWDMAVVVKYHGLDLDGSDRS